MKVIIALLLFATVTPSQAKYKTLEEIQDHRAKGNGIKRKFTKPFFYSPLDTVIPKKHRDRVDHLRKMKKERKHHTSFNLYDLLIPSAEAMACKPIVAPTSTPTPTVSPSPVTSVSPTPVSSATKVDLRNCATSVKTQTSPHCTAYGLAASMEEKMCDGRELSEAQIWSLYRVYDVDAALNGTTGQLITTRALWPEDYTLGLNGYAAEAKTRLLRATYLGDDYDQYIPAMKQALRDGKPVYIGFAVWVDLAEGREIVTAANGVTKGGHAVSVVGFMDDAKAAGGGYFILKNSWGVEAHDKGYAYVEYAACESNGAYCFMYSIDSVEKLK